MPFTDHSRDAQAYATDVKTLVIDHVNLARRSKEPADQVRLIVNELEDFSNRPFGEFKEVYSQLLEESQSILSACEAVDGRPNGLEKQLESLLAIAEKLPGTVHLGSE